MNDTQLEERIRATLRSVADAAPRGTSRGGRPRSSTPRWVLAAASVLVAATIAAVALGVAAADRDGDGEGTRTADPVAMSPASRLPAGFDPAAATPVFTADGDADAVATAYVRSRLPRLASLAPVEMTGVVGRARWTTSSELEGVHATGEVLLRHIDGGWGVVAATTDAVDLGGLRYDGGHLRGVIQSESDELLRVELLDWRNDTGERLRRAPEPFDSSDGTVTLDVEHRLAPVIVRANLVGGSILSITEVRLDAPPLAPHRDLEGCIRQHTTAAKEPTPDVLRRLCEASLEGTVVASGSGTDPAWELVASDEPTGHWVTLRWRDLVGQYRLQTDGEFDSLFTQIGPCCAIEGDTVVVGALRRDATGMQVVLGDGRAIAAQAFADPATGVRYAVVVVPQELVASSPTAETQIRVGDRWQDGPTMNLAVLGG